MPEPMPEPATKRDRVESLYAALASGDAAILDRLLAVDFVGQTTEGLPNGLGGRYDGRDRMRDDFWWALGRSFRARAEPSEIVEQADGRLMVRGTYRGTARATGRELTAAFVHLVEFDHDGLIAGLDQITDSAAWVAALEPGESTPSEPTPSEPAERRVDDTRAVVDEAPVQLATMTVEIADAVGTITLDRPEQHNAINGQMPLDLLAAARICADSPAVRAILIRGNGPSLTVGGDIAHFRSHGSDNLGALLGDMTSSFHDAFRLLSAQDAPIVTAAQGAVAGGGIGLVYIADIVIASDDARFVTAFAGLGVSGDGGGTWFLPRLVGHRRAVQMYLENTPMTAAEALQHGIVTRVVPPEELRPEADRTARRLAAGPTAGFGEMRRLLLHSWDRDLSSQYAAETAALITSGNSRDAKAAVTAFLEKRRPTFEGK